MTIDTPPSFLITGTGTGVGKTLVCGALAAALRARGRSAVYLKPVESGVTAGVESDTDRMAAALCGEDRARRTVGLRLPLAPLAAAELDGAPSITATALTADYEAWRARHPGSVCLVEGAGGLTVSIVLDDGEPDGVLTFSSLAARWSLPLIIVADAALGTLNHTLLTVEHARRRGLRMAGIVINNFPAMLEPEQQDDWMNSIRRMATEPLSFEELREALRRIPAARRGDAAWSNPAMMSALTRERLIGVIPRLPAAPLAEQAARAGQFLHISSLNI